MKPLLVTFFRFVFCNLFISAPLRGLCPQQYNSYHSLSFRLCDWGYYSISFFNFHHLVVIYQTNSWSIVNMKAIFLVMNTTWAVVKIRPEKNSGLCRIWTHDLCDTGAVKTVYCCLLLCSRRLCDWSKYHTFNFDTQNDTVELSGQAVSFKSIFLFKWRVSLLLFSISKSFSIESTY